MRIYEENGVADGEVTNRLYGAVRENSIDFSQIPPYIGQRGSNDLFAWELRSVPNVQLLRVLGRKGRERAQV